MKALACVHLSRPIRWTSWCRRTPTRPVTTPITPITTQRSQSNLKVHNNPNIHKMSALNQNHYDKQFYVFTLHCNSSCSLWCTEQRMRGITKGRTLLRV